MSVASPPGLAGITPAASPAVEGPARRRGRVAGPALITGLILVLGPLLAAFIIRFFLSAHGLDVFSAKPTLEPSAAHPLGTDSSGRDVFTSLVYGTGATYEIGLIGGAAGTAIGVLVGLISAYFGKLTDIVLRGLSDILIGIPPIAILIVVTVMYRITTVEELGLLVAIVSWPVGARGIRSQVLTLRERSFVTMARLSNRTSLGIMVGEILPNMASLVVANLVSGIFGSLATAIALQLLGLGPTTIATWGFTLQTAITGGALSQGLWWWWVSPAVLLIIVFVGLFSLTAAVDVIANPRLRRGRAHG